MKNRENPTGGLRLRMLVGALAGATLAAGAPAALGQNSPGNQPAQESDPFAPAPPKARELPSILERNAQGEVIWIEGDPARKAIKVMDLPAAQRRVLERILAERDNQLLRAAVPNTDKIVKSLRAWREGEEVEYDAFGRHVMASLGDFGRRGAFAVDAEVRKNVTRGIYTDLNDVIREYNLARVAEEREELLAEAEGTEVSEVLLRDSTILQRFQQRDVIADAARMLKKRYGGDEALIQAHPKLAETLQSEGYWAAMSELTDAQLAAFVFDHTQLEVRFPSPEGEEALTALARQEQEREETQEAGPQANKPANNGNAGNRNAGPRKQQITAQGDVQPDAEGRFNYTDEDLEGLRVPQREGPSIMRRGADGEAIRLEGASYAEAYELMLAEDMLSEDDVQELEVLIEDRARVFDEQALRLYEFLIEAASHGPVEEGPLARAVLDPEWTYSSLMYGAWLNEKLPAPSTFHNDVRIREAMEWDSLVEMARIANEYDAAHIFDARIELLKMVRDDETMNDPEVALPGNIKRPWRLQQIIRDAKASYARQLRVTEPDFRAVLAELDLEGDAAEAIKDVVAADGPMTAAEFWEVAVKLPLEAHRELIEKRTGYEAPEPGYFDDKTPVPTTGAPPEG